MRRSLPATGVRNLPIERPPRSGRCPQTVARLRQVVSRLQIHPELGRGAELSSEQDRGLCGDAPRAVQDGGNPVCGHADLSREPGSGHPERHHEFLVQHLAGRDPGKPFARGHVREVGVG